MIKRAQGRKRFGMKNFKKRWFRLTNHEFTYQKSKGNEIMASVPSVFSLNIKEQGRTLFRIRYVDFSKREKCAKGRCNKFFEIFNDRKCSNDVMLCYEHLK